MPSCIILCYHHESHDKYVFCKQGWAKFQITLTKGCHIFGFMLLYGIVINVSKNINPLLIGEWYFVIFQINT
jgi:hypothetical protein